MTTTITDVEYTFLNHIIFDGVSSTDLFYVTDMSYTLLDKDVQTEVLGKQDGLNIKLVRSPEKEFTIDILFTTDQLVNNKITNIYDLRRTIANYFNSDEPKELIFSADPAVYRKVIYKGNSEIEFLTNNTCTTKVTFLNPTGLEYARDPKISNNFEPKTYGNLFLHPDFDLKDKYCYEWTFIEPSETFEGSKVLTGVMDVDTEKIWGGSFHNWFKPAAKWFAPLKQGDPISASIWVRLNEFKAGDKETSIAIILEEYDSLGGKATVASVVPAQSFNGITGVWKQFKILNYKIKGANTKYIGLMPQTQHFGNLSIAKPQINLGSTLSTYAVSVPSLTNQLTLENDGTYKSYPKFRAKLTSEAGFVGFVNSNGGVLQFGNPETLDGTTSIRSDKVINAGFEGSFPAGTLLNQGITSYPNYTSDGTSTPNRQKGSWNWSDKNVAAPVYSSLATDRWNGPSFTFPIPTNYLAKNTGDFKWVSRFNFFTGIKDRGHIEFGLNAGGKHLLGFVMRDSAYTKKEMIAEFHLFDVIADRSFPLDLKKFNGHFFEIQIKKQGNKVTFQLAQITTITSVVNLKKDAILTKTYTDERFRNMGVENAFYWAKRFKNLEVVKMNFTDSRFEWVNVPIWKDAANIFNEGDELEVDVKAKKLYLNGVEANDSAYHSISNEWDKFVLKPSSSTIVQTVTSDWAKTPEFESEFEEAYI